MPNHKLTEDEMRAYLEAAGIDVKPTLNRLGEYLAAVDQRVADAREAGRVEMSAAVSRHLQLCWALHAIVADQCYDSTSAWESATSATVEVV